MKIKYLMSIMTLMIMLISCHENVSDDHKNQNVQKTIQGKISSEIINQNLYDDCDIVCAGGESEIINGNFDIKTYVNNNVQTFIVSDASENVYLIYRTSLSKDKEIKIDTYSTALALVTLHPLFAPFANKDYDEITNIITSSPKFEILISEVEKAVQQKRNIFDETNEDLLLSLSNLLDDISNEINEDDFSGDIDDIVNIGDNRSRAIYDHPSVYPFHADITRNVLTLRNTGLTPSYYGTVREANGKETPISVPSRSDYGGMDIFKTVDDIMLGEPRKFTFTQQGEYHFYLSRMNAAAQADFWLRLANSILTSLGLDLGNDVIQELGNAISRAMINANSGVNDELSDPMEWIGIAYGAMVRWMQQDYWAATGKAGIIRLGTVLGGSLNFYNKIKGSANAGLRITHALSAPEEVNFCLCYYNSKVSTCSEAILHILSGNNQQGYGLQRLLLPLEVNVENLENDNNSYHRVKFEVISGGGKVESELVSTDYKNNASTYWTLGKEGEQKVKVTVVDIITDKEISEPVYFTANLEKADITIRLDWSKHSGRTDIDLHVVDPFGEEIAFYHMNSASGGYLDRDDTVGPGPEHVRWSDAPEGTYKIYIHYYGGDSKAVTNYMVSVSAAGNNYKPKTGSIAYDQTIPIGQFTIVNGSVSRSTSIQMLDSTDNRTIKRFPKE